MLHCTPVFGRFHGRPRASLPLVQQKASQLCCAAFMLLSFHLFPFAEQATAPETVPFADLFAEFPFSNAYVFFVHQPAYLFNGGQQLGRSAEWVAPCSNLEGASLLSDQAKKRVSRSFLLFQLSPRIGDSHSVGWLLLLVRKNPP